MKSHYWYCGFEFDCWYKAREEIGYLSLHQVDGDGDDDDAVDEKNS